VLPLPARRVRTTGSSTDVVDLEPPAPGHPPSDRRDEEGRVGTLTIDALGPDVNVVAHEEMLTEATSGSPATT
jgi:hypothetical protein